MDKFAKLEYFPMNDANIVGILGLQLIEVLTQFIFECRSKSYYFVDEYTNSWQTTFTTDKGFKNVFIFLFPVTHLAFMEI